tara:strand:- start:1409 stop:1594 length:186 start_codon:yes stop_codon:yes gene_type:complete
MDSMSLPTLKPDLIALNAAVAPAIAVTGSINFLPSHPDSVDYNCIYLKLIFGKVLVDKEDI